MKKLKDCGHLCLGLCGETCPPVCHKCDTVKEKVHKIYSDEKCHEESAGHRYIILEDCQHVFSVQSLDRWMECGQHQAVEWKCCPLDSCKTPVMSTLRYANTAKQILRDMNKLKTREAYFLDSHLRQQMTLKLSQIDTEELKKNGLNITPIKDNDKDITVQKRYVFALSAVNALQVQKDVEMMISLANVYNISDTENLKLLLSQAKDFISWMRHQQRLSKLTDQMILDTTAESRRLTLLKKYYEVKHTLGYLPIIFIGNHENDDEKLLNKVLESENLASEFSGPEQQSMIEALRSVIDALWRRISLTRKEEDKIACMTGAKPGLWYRCPQGHYYIVSECNGDSQVGRCPDCRVK